MLDTLEPQHSENSFYYNSVLMLTNAIRLQKQIKKLLQYIRIDPILICICLLASLEEPLVLSR